MEEAVEVLCNLQHLSSLLTAFTQYCHGYEQSQLGIHGYALRLTIVLPVGSPVSLAVLLIFWDLMLYM